VNLEVGEAAARKSRGVSRCFVRGTQRAGENARSVLGRCHVGAVLDLDRLLRRLNQAPELALEVVLDGELLAPHVVVDRPFRRVLGAPLALALRQRVVLQPLALERVGAAAEAVQAVVLAFLKAVIGAVEQKALVAVELRRRDLLERRREARQVVPAVAVLAQDDAVRVVVEQADLARLQSRQVNVLRLKVDREGRRTSPGARVSFAERVLSLNSRSSCILSDAVLTLSVVSCIRRLGPASDRGAEGESDEPLAAPRGGELASLLANAFISADLASSAASAASLTGSGGAGPPASLTRLVYSSKGRMMRWYATLSCEQMLVLSATL